MTDEIRRYKIRTSLLEFDKQSELHLLQLAHHLHLKKVIDENKVVGSPEIGAVYDPNNFCLISVIEVTKVQNESNPVLSCKLAHFKNKMQLSNLVQAHRSHKPSKLKRFF